MRIFLIVAGVVAIVLIGSLFARTQPLFRSPLEIAVTTPTAVVPTSPAETMRTTVLPTSTSAAALTICTPDDGASACPPVELDPSQNLADPGNGIARLAVAKDARPAHEAKYVNDGRDDTSWVSNSADSWIKLDLGQFRTFNLVSLEKGNSAQENDLGSFVIAVALSDVYADGDSSNDDREYAPVFDSEQADVSGMDGHTAMINILFSPVEARFVKITFEREGASIEEVGVFMAEPSGLVGQPTRTPAAIWYATRTSTPGPDDRPDNPPVSTAALSQTPISTPQPSNTPAPLPTQTQPPADTSTPVPTAPLPTLELPTVIIPTLIVPTIELSKPPG